MSFIFNKFWQFLGKNDTSIFYLDTDKKYERGQLLISCFYIFIFLMAFKSLSSYPLLNTRWDELLEGEKMFMPLWSVEWVSYLEWDFAVYLILFSFFTFSFLGIFLWKKRRIIRILVFLSFFFYASFISSFGKIDHYLHLALIGSFFFIFLPDIKFNHSETKIKNAQITFLMIFWGFQLFILTTYSTSGIFKFYGILDQELQGLTSALDPSALAQNVAKVSMGTNRETILGTFIIENPGYIFSFLLVIGYLVELVSVAIAFLPKLHRSWGLILILLHSIIVVTIGADFLPQIFIIGMFLVLSPFNLDEALFPFERKKSVKKKSF